MPNTSTATDKHSLMVQVTQPAEAVALDVESERIKFVAAAQAQGLSAGDFKLGAFLGWLLAKQDAAHPAPASASEPEEIETWDPESVREWNDAFPSASVAGAGEARLRELLEQAEACLSAKIQIGQVFPDEPPMPLDEWSYGADQIAHAIRHELQICYPDECKTVSECNSMGCRIEREKEGQRP